MRAMIAVLVVSVLAPFASAQQHENPRIVSTTGEAVIYVVPDEVVVGLGIEKFSQNLDRAKAANDEASHSLLRAIREFKIEEKHIQTDVMSVELRYRSGASHEIEGYVCRRSYSITLKDTKMFEKLIDAALKNGANQLMGFEFKTTELRKHRDQARKMAIKAAKEKATDLAKELDCRVGKPRTIGEGYSQASYGGWWGWRGGNWQGQNTFQNVNQDAGGGGEGGQTMPLGQIAIRASISVTFDLEP